MASETIYCSDCKSITVVIFDHAAGDVICTECGLVLESSYIDDTSEWRTFSNEANTTDTDPNRVGSASNPLFAIDFDGKGSSASPLNTIISSSKSNSSEQRQWQSKNKLIDLKDADNRRQQTLIQAFKDIENMAERLGLVAVIKNRACENYKRVVVDDPLCLKFVKGRKSQDATMAACLYVACRQEEKPRTVKEICSVAGKVTKKELGRAKEYIMKKLNDQAATIVAVDDQHKMGAVNAEDFIRRFCSRLGMSNGSMKVAQEALKMVTGELDIRRSPISVAAAVIYMIIEHQMSKTDSCQKLEKKRQLLKDVSIATGVSEGTIKIAYKELNSYATRLIPDKLK